MVTGLKALLDGALKSGNGYKEVNNISRLPESTEGHSPRIRGAGTGKCDFLSLSEPLKALKDIGVNLEGSSFSQSTQALEFNLQFSDEHIENLTSRGAYDFHSQSLKVDFSFSSVLTVADSETGEERKEFFQFDFHLEASQIQAVLDDQNGRAVDKEDIFGFARKLIKKLSKLASEGKNVDGLALNDEQVKEDLGSTDEARLLKGMRKIIELLRHGDRTRGRNEDYSRLQRGHDEARITGWEQQEEGGSRMNLSVSLLSTDITFSSTTERSQTEATAVQSGPEQHPPETGTMQVI